MTLKCSMPAWCYQQVAWCWELRDTKLTVFRGEAPPWAACHRTAVSSLWLAPRPGTGWVLKTTRQPTMCAGMQARRCVRRICKACSMLSTSNNNRSCSHAHALSWGMKLAVMEAHRWVAWRRNVGNRRTRRHTGGCAMFLSMQLFLHMATVGDWPWELVGPVCTWRPLLCAHHYLCTHLAYRHHHCCYRCNHHAPSYTLSPFSGPLHPQNPHRDHHTLVPRCLPAGDDCASINYGPLRRWWPSEVFCARHGAVHQATWHACPPPCLSLHVDGRYGVDLCAFCIIECAHAGSVQGAVHACEGHEQALEQPVFGCCTCTSVHNPTECARRW